MVIEHVYYISFDEVISYESNDFIELYDIYKHETEARNCNPDNICVHCKHVPGYHTMISLLNLLYNEIIKERCVYMQLKHVTTMYVLLRVHPEIVKYNANLRATLIDKAREFKTSPAIDRKTKKLLNDYIGFAKKL